MKTAEDFLCSTPRNWATILRVRHSGAARNLEPNNVEPEFQTQFVTAGSLLYSVEHRPWLPPDAQWLFSQSWNDVLFAHFAVEPSVLRPLVPEALTLDLYDGAAWLTISPFRTSHLRPSGVPPLPKLSFFPQVNLRTCVSRDGKPGVFNFSADAASLSAVWFARVFFRVPYWHAAIEVAARPCGRARAGGEDTIGFRSRRLHGPAALSGAATLDVAYAPAGAAERARPGSLDEFLTERYCVYSCHHGKLYRTELHHQPWPLQPASVELREQHPGRNAGPGLACDAGPLPFFPLQQAFNVGSGVRPAHALIQRPSPPLREGNKR